MKHTKNILKSLLIMVMALSLLAVSCSKDEGGSKNPTNPTPITINAATLTAAIQAAGKAATITGATINFDALKIADGGSADLEATLSDVITLANLKKELESGLSFSSAVATATATAEVPSANTGKEAVTVTIKINAGNNTFADDVKTAYKVVDKVATVNITITPDKKWDGNAKD